MSTNFKNTVAAIQTTAQIEPPLQGRKLFLRFTLFRTGKVVSGNHEEVSGTCLVSSDCGTASYSCNGSMAHELIGDRFTLHDLVVKGHRLSGFDAGDMRISAESVDGLSEDGCFHIPVQLNYSDANNECLWVGATLSGTISSAGLLQLDGDGTGDGFCFASFLADGETLDEESGEEGAEEDDDSEDEGDNEDEG